MSRLTKLIDKQNKKVVEIIVLKSIRTAVKKEKTYAAETDWEIGYNEGIETAVNVITDRINKLKA